MQVEPFTWGSQAVTDQLDACSVYLRRVIDSPKHVSWIDASQHPTLLTVDSTGVLPFSTNTTADLAICRRSAVRPHAFRDNLMVLFEVCKVVTTSEYYQVSLLHCVMIALQWQTYIARFCLPLTCAGEQHAV